MTCEVDNQDYPAGMGAGDGVVDIRDAEGVVGDGMGGVRARRSELTRKEQGM